MTQIRNLIVCCLLCCVVAVAAENKTASSAMSEISDAECIPYEIQCVDIEDDDYTCEGDYMSGCLINCCPIDYFCVKGQCIMDSDGDDCTVVANCTAGVYGTRIVNCVDGECIELMNSGDSCEDDSDCVYGMECHKDKCQAKSGNQTCLSTIPMSEPRWVIYGQDCDDGYYCDPASKVCVKMIQEKGNCTVGGMPFCGINLVCDPISGTCIKMFSTDKDKPCDTRALYACDSDLYCHATAGTVGTCVEAIDDDYEDCDISSDCDGNVTCSCLTDGHKYCERNESATQGPCMDDLKDVYKCYQDNDCSTGILSQNENSCQEINCAQELANYRTCVLCDSYPLGSCLSSKEDDKYCPAAQLETWEKLTILAVIVVVVIVIIVVITACCCCSKRKDYQPI